MIRVYGTVFGNSNATMALHEKENDEEFESNTMRVTDGVLEILDDNTGRVIGAFSKWDSARRIEPIETTHPIPGL